jgi:hypothetical protein
MTDGRQALLLQLAVQDLARNLLTIFCHEIAASAPSATRTASSAMAAVIITWVVRSCWNTRPARLSC